MAKTALRPAIEPAIAATDLEEAEPIVAQEEQQQPGELSTVWLWRIDLRTEEVSNG